MNPKKIKHIKLFSSGIDSWISLFCVTAFVCVCDAAGTHFKRIIPDEGPATADPQKVKRVVFCTGKIYYELIRERRIRGMDDTVAVVRIEQVKACRTSIGSDYKMMLQVLCIV